MNSDVIIVAKTRMSRWLCVGGLLDDGRFVRLLNEFGYNQSEDSAFEVGEVYNIDFVNRTVGLPPHVEDILVSRFVLLRCLSNNELIAAIKDRGRAHFWEGSTEVLFDGKIRWTHAGSGYINEENIPTSSTGFWIPDKPLTRSEYGGKLKYAYPPVKTSAGGIVISASPGWRTITFVGLQQPVEVIPAGTVCRVSLARWWKPDDLEVEERCHLQLSGWYEPGDKT